VVACYFMPTSEYSSVRCRELTQRSKIFDERAKHCCKCRCFGDCARIALFRRGKDSFRKNIRQSVPDLNSYADAAPSRAQCTCVEAGTNHVRGKERLDLIHDAQESSVVASVGISPKQRVDSPGLLLVW
jgi:hypothetical protein